MSIMAKQGVCLHCGHDHRNPNKPMIPPVFKELADAEADIDILSSHNIELQQQLATTERLLAESQAREDRFFFDHGLWHDRVTGQHMYTQDQYDQLRREAFHAGYAPDSTALDAAIAKAKREENEACAKVCESHVTFFGNGIELRKRLAYTIRRRMADELKGGER